MQRKDNQNTMPFLHQQFSEDSPELLSLVNFKKCCDVEWFNFDWEIFKNAFGLRLVCVCGV